MSTELIEAAPSEAVEALHSKTLATIRDDQQTFDDKQVAILRQLGIEEATQADIALFFHYCRTTGLDPFRKQIYMVGRNTKVTEWVGEGSGRRKEEKWVTKYTIQTGIDGYRRNARETANRLGDTIFFDGPYWCGEDGEWKEVWPSKTPPTAAKYTVLRNGEPFAAIVHYDEFVQTGRDGTPNSMWGKMPRNQIGKCAEAMAYRRAFPDDFAGLIMEDAAQPTVIDQDGNVERRPASTVTRTSAPVSADEILGVIDEPVVELEPEKAVRKPRTRKQPEPLNEMAEDDAEPSEISPEPDTSQVSDSGEAVETDLRKSARGKLTGAIFSIFGDVGLGLVANREDRLVVIAAIVGHTVTSSNELTDDELQNLRNGLYSRQQAGTLEADINDWLNIAALKEMNAAESTETEGN